jgi:cold shock CspA family protein
MTKKVGTIIYFNPQDYHGKIKVDGLDKDVYFNSQEIQEEAINLLKDEMVEFELVGGKERDSYAAKAVNRVDKRYTGVVLDFEDGKGTVKCYQTNDDVSIYYKDFVNTDLIPIHEYTRVKVEPGDDIEFSVSEDMRYGKKATNIFYDGRKPLSRFASLPMLDSKLANLARISPEPWDYMNSDPENRFLPVLKNYLFYTFARLRKEEKLFDEKRIAIAKAEVSYRDRNTNKTIRKEIDCACFNTGLATNYQEEIFAYFVKNKNYRTRIDPEWHLYKFCKASDPEMKAFAEKPEWANYFRELDALSEILYDTTSHHELKYEHILKDRQERFPEALKLLPESVLKDLLDQGLAKARKRVRRNYKAAVPQYYNGKLQLLLPLSLISQDKADLALAVEKDGKRYISRTVLKLEWAYSNARLLAKPDREWLDPVKEMDIKTLEAKEKERDTASVEVDTE